MSPAARGKHAAAIRESRKGGQPLHGLPARFSTALKSAWRGYCSRAFWISFASSLTISVTSVRRAFCISDLVR